MQRPYLPIQHPYMLKPNTRLIESQEGAFSIDDKRQISGVKRLFDERFDDFAIKSINLGWNSPQIGIRGPPIWSIPPLLPAMSCSLGALLSKLPSVIPSYDTTEAIDTNLLVSSNNKSTSQAAKVNNHGLVSQGHVASTTKVESSCQLDAGKPISLNPNSELENETVGFGNPSKRESSLNLS